MDVRVYLSYDSRITLKSHMLFENSKILPYIRRYYEHCYIMNVMAHQVIMSSQEENKQFVDTVASPSYSVSIMTLPGEGKTNTRNFNKQKNLKMYLLKQSVIRITPIRP